ncbi:hypothetical protein GCM10023321_20070 [Pseudonocardia eucalypti]|uniref:DUF3784 domain-containing protein n=1 Tax=Pseudonocardia eucalypti TaxID=648755 RepID=A0ABP9PTP0_9PSEU|nr:putative outer membrane lipoprotein [Pseudonocardia eucalypti]
MAAAFAVVASLIALLGVLLTLANAGYLALLSSAAGKRGLPGAPTLDYVRGERKLAAGLVVLAVLGLLCTVGSALFTDLLGLVLAGAAGVAGYRALSATRARFRRRS